MQVSVEEDYSEVPVDRRLYRGQHCAALPNGSGVMLSDVVDISKSKQLPQQQYMRTPDAVVSYQSKSHRFMLPG
jgi:hypothetical protein